MIFQRHFESVTIPSTKFGRGLACVQTYTAVKSWTKSSSRLITNSCRRVLFSSRQFIESTRPLVKLSRWVVESSRPVVYITYQSILVYSSVIRQLVVSPFNSSCRTSTRRIALQLAVLYIRISEPVVWTRGLWLLVKPSGPFINTS